MEFNINPFSLQFKIWLDMNFSNEMDKIFIESNHDYTFLVKLGSTLSDFSLENSLSNPNQIMDFLDKSDPDYIRRLLVLYLMLDIYVKQEYDLKKIIKLSFLLNLPVEYWNFITKVWFLNQISKDENSQKINEFPKHQEFLNGILFSEAPKHVLFNIFSTLVKVITNFVQNHRMDISLFEIPHSFYNYYSSDLHISFNNQFDDVNQFSSLKDINTTLCYNHLYFDALQLIRSYLVFPDDLKKELLKQMKSIAESTESFDTFSILPFTEEENDLIQ